MASKRNETTETKAPATAPAIIPTVELGELKTVNLNEIDLSYDNQRTGKWHLDQSSKSTALNENSFQELVESIEAVGQRDPVTVRPIKGKGKVKYQLIKGFRRVAAIRHISERNGSPAKGTATVSVIIKELDEVQAFHEHVIENASRENLKGPDLAFAAYKMLQLNKAKGNNLSRNDVAKIMGKNQSYMAQLFRIVESAPEIAELWRESSLQLSTAEMDRIAKQFREPAAQKDAYLRLVKAAEDQDSPDAWVRAAEDKASSVASQVGTLERAGLITRVAGVQWADKFAAMGIKVKEGATMSQLQSIAAAADKAYNLALNPPEKAPKGAKGKKAAEKTADA